jgi:NADPH:quinone reductase-like Zn-dependent oxidoreductase
MKTIAYHKFGNTTVLQTVEEPTPLTQSNQVLVKVIAVSINPMDWKIRKGEMKLMSGSTFPKHTGVEFAGIIEDAGTSNFNKGDAVFGTVKNTMKEGGLAAYVAVPTTSLWKKPAAIDFQKAASLPIAGAAAATILEKMGNITSNTQILVNGATGGVGMFLLQLLKAEGANITAVASSHAVDIAKKWGADTVIDYTQRDILAGQKAYDMVIDLSGKMGYKNAKQIMKANSRFFNLTPKPIEIPISLINNLFTGKKHVVVISKPVTKHIDLLLHAIHQGLAIEINKVFPLAKAQEAYRYAEKGGIIGKVVIDVTATGQQ